VAWVRVWLFCGSTGNRVEGVAWNAASLEEDDAGGAGRRRPVADWRALAALRNTTKNVPHNSNNEIKNNFIKEPKPATVVRLLFPRVPVLCACVCVCVCVLVKKTVRRAEFHLQKKQTKNKQKTKKRSGTIKRGGAEGGGQVLRPWSLRSIGGS